MNKVYCCCCCFLRYNHIVHIVWGFLRRIVPISTLWLTGPEKKSGNNRADYPAVGYHFGRGLLVYIGPWFKSKTLVCNSIRPSGMDIYYTGLPDARNALETQPPPPTHPLPAYYGLFGEATCCVSVWNGGLTESTASVHYLHPVLD